MEHYRKSSHTTYDIKYHLVWITEYRKRVLTGEIAKRARELIREICRGCDVQIIKGKSSRKMMSEFKTLSRQFWGRHIWARGYFVASSGNVTDEVIMQYIELQGKEPEDGNFRIDGAL